MANTVISVKKSTVSGNVPSTLVDGELAINTADGKLFYRNAGGTISSIQNQNTFSTINANSSLIVATSNSDILSIVPGNNILIVANTTTKTITISANVVATSSNNIPTSNVFTGTAYTLTTADAGNFVYSNTSSNNVVYIDPNIIPVNDPVTIVQLGTGYTSVVANAGTTLVLPNAALALCRTQYSAITLLQPTQNFFILSGDMGS